MVIVNSLIRGSIFVPKMIIKGAWIMAGPGRTRSGPFKHTFHEVDSRPTTCNGPLAASF